MNSSANDTFDPTHSSDSDSDGNPGVSSAYVDRPSASSLNATLLADTQTLATPATSDKIVSDSLQHFFSMSMVADLTKHLFTLGPEAIEEIAAILQVTVAPSTTTQSTARYMDRSPWFLRRMAYKFCTQFAHIHQTLISDCDAKSRSLGLTLPIVR